MVGGYVYIPDEITKAVERLISAGTQSLVEYVPNIFKKIQLVAATNKIPFSDKLSFNAASKEIKLAPTLVLLFYSESEMTYVLSLSTPIGVITVGIKENDELSVRR